MPLRPRTALLALWLALASCASPTRYGENRERLAAGVAAIEARDPRRAVRGMEDLLVETAEEGERYRLQRFYACYLLTLAHETASLDAPFLQGGGTDSRLAGAAARGGDPLAHLVAVTYHAPRGRELGEGLGEPRLERDGEPLLPAPLASLAPSDALAHLELALLAVYSRLQFQERCGDLLRAMPAMASLAGAEALLASSRLPEGLHPWIHYAAFDHLRRSDEKEAYRFGVRARQTAAASAGTFGEAHRERIARWIQLESSYEFVSPAGQRFDPATDRCPVSNTPQLEFEPIPRERPAGTR